MQLVNKDETCRKGLWRFVGPINESFMVTVSDSGRGSRYYTLCGFAQ